MQTTQKNFTVHGKIPKGNDPEDLISVIYSKEDESTGFQADIHRAEYDYLLKLNEAYKKIPKEYHNDLKEILEAADDYMDWKISYERRYYD